MSGPVDTCVDPGRKATRSECPSAARGRPAAGRWAPGSGECRRCGTWTSGGWRGKRAGPATGRCACAAGRRWSSVGRGECGSWTGGGGWRKSADGGRRVREKRKRRRCRRERCSCRRWWWRSGRWLDTWESLSASAVGNKQQGPGRLLGPFIACRFCLIAFYVRGNDPQPVIQRLAIQGFFCCCF